MFCVVSKTLSHQLGKTQRSADVTCNMHSLLGPVTTRSPSRLRVFLTFLFFIFIFSRCRKLALLRTLIGSCAVRRSRAYDVHGQSQELIKFERWNVPGLPGLALATVYWTARIAYKRTLYCLRFARYTGLVVLRFRHQQLRPTWLAEFE